MSLRNRSASLLLLALAPACAVAGTDGFTDASDGSVPGPVALGSGGVSSVGGTSSTGGKAPVGTSTGGGTSSSTGGGGPSGPGPFPFPGPGSGSGGSSGSGGASANACTPVTCGANHPKPTGDVCFAFTTTQYGGWQASNTAGCTLTFDGVVTPSPGVNPVSAGEHELEFSGCTSADIGWSCWN